MRGHFLEHSMFSESCAFLIQYKPGVPRLARARPFGLAPQPLHTGAAFLILKKLVMLNSNAFVAALALVQHLVSFNRHAELVSASRS